MFSAPRSRSPSVPSTPELSEDVCSDTCDTDYSVQPGATSCTSGLAFLLALGPFPHSSTVFGDWLDTTVVDSAFATSRPTPKSVHLSRKDWDEILDHLEVHTEILSFVRFTYYEPTETLYLRVMSKAHTVASNITGSSLHQDAKQSLGNDVGSMVQFGNNLATCKARTETGKMAMQIPDTTGYVEMVCDKRAFKLFKLNKEPEYDAENAVECYRLEVSNTEDANHAIKKLGCWNTVAGLAVPEQIQEQESGERVLGEARELEDVLYKVLARLPLFLINFERSPIPKKLNDEAARIAATSTEEHIHHINRISEKALTGPMAWNGRVRSGDMFVQLLAFSGQEALDCLREGARDKWNVQKFIDRGYGCHIVEDYNQSPEASHERERFEPQLRKTMVAVRVIVVRAYAGVRITQLTNEDPEMSGAEIEKRVSAEVHILLKKANSEPTVDILHLLSHKIDLAFIEEQQDRLDEELLRAKLKRKRRDMSPEVFGVSGAHITAPLDSDPEECEASIGYFIHERSLQLERHRTKLNEHEEASRRAQAGEPDEPVQDEKRKVKKQKRADQRIPMILKGQPTSIPFVGPYRTHADMEQEADEEAEVPSPVDDEDRDPSYME